jgi:hypothetical protein
VDDLVRHVTDLQSLGKRLFEIVVYPEWFKAAPPMRFELRGLLAAGLKQKRIHGLS